MVRMIIDRSFNLLLGGGQKIAFKAGEQEVADELADHWYVKANGRSVTEAPAQKRKKAAQDQDGQDAPSASSDLTGQDAEAGAGDGSGDADGNGETADNTDADTDDRAALVVEATSLGINVDGRWGVDRIKSAIAEAKKG